MNILYTLRRADRLRWAGCGGTGTLTLTLTLTRALTLALTLTLTLPLTRWDRHTGEQLKWIAPPGCFCEEVVLIPKRRVGGDVDGSGGAEAAAEEDMADCWVVAMMLDSRRNASCLCILDAARIEADPVA